MCNSNGTGCNVFNNFIHIKMKMTKTYSWNRRDFCYDAKCEFCGNETTNNYGYDDSYFRNEVIPNEECSKCKQKGVDHLDFVTTGTKYKPNVIM